MRGKKIIAVLLAVLMMVSAAAVMTSCGKKEKAPENLEEYVKTSESATEELGKISDSIENELLDGTMAVEGNNLIITLKYKETYDEQYLDSMKEAMEGKVNELKSSFDDTIADLEKQSGVDNIGLKLIVQNGDGSEIFSSDL